MIVNKCTAPAAVLATTSHAHKPTHPTQGAVTSMCTWGGDLLVVTGTQGRSLNPYDTSGTAPTRYVPDPMIKAGRKGGGV